MITKKILIVDDDIQIGNLEQEVLEQRGYLCLRAYSGTEAVLLLERERPDLILLDLMLPGLSGEEVLKKIGEIPVIVVSAKAGVYDKVALLLGGAQDYMTKPFSTKELLARVEVQLRKSAASLPAQSSTGSIVMNQLSHCVEIWGAAGFPDQNRVCYPEAAASESGSGDRQVCDPRPNQ